MTYKVIDPVIGAQPITEVSATQMHPLGTIVRADDVVATGTSYGSGEFIYLKGVANTVVGSWVTYNMDDGTTALLAANAIGPVGVAMSANAAATTFGWYQISGKAVGKALAAYADNALVWATGTAGSVDDTVVDGDMVHLAKGASAIDGPGTGLAEFEIHRPYNDDILTND